MRLKRKKHHVIDLLSEVRVSRIAREWRGHALSRSVGTTASNFKYLFRFRPIIEHFKSTPTAIRFLDLKIPSTVTFNLDTKYDMLNHLGQGNLLLCSGALSAMTWWSFQHLHDTVEGRHLQVASVRDQDKVCP